MATTPTDIEALLRQKQIMEQMQQTTAQGTQADIIPMRAAGAQPDIPQQQTQSGGTGGIGKALLGLIPGIGPALAGASTIGGGLLSLARGGPVQGVGKNVQQQAIQQMPDPGTIPSPLSPAPNVTQYDPQALLRLQLGNQ